MSSTVTIQQVVNFAATQAELVPLSGVGGFSNEPALSLANDTIASILHATPWKFNRVEMGPLVTTPFKQDYDFAGAVAWTETGGVAIGLASGNAITESSFTVTVNTLNSQPHNFTVGQTVYMTGNTVAAYNSTFSSTPSASGWSGGWTITAVPTTTSFQFTHASSGLSNSGAAGITNFGWLESGTFVDVRDTSPSQGVYYLKAVRTLQPTSSTSLPGKVCVLSASSTGVLKIRFIGVPGQPWMVTLVYQAAAPLKTALSDTWSPFPDEYAYAYRQMFLAHAYRHINSKRSEIEYQKALQMIANARQDDDSEMSDENMAPAGGSLMGWTWQSW